MGNTATGSSALAANAAGYDNTAIGAEALLSNTTGYENTAAGREALRANTTGYRNTAVGRAALAATTTGAYNTAVGETALASNTSGHRNSALGRTALHDNTIGYSNTAMGAGSLAANTTGDHNVAQGQFALRYNTTGSRNTAVGPLAGVNATTGDDNIYLGSGAEGVAGETHTIRVGGTTVGMTAGEQNRTFVNGIRGTSVVGGQTVVIDAFGQLGSTAGGAGSGLTADTVDGFHAGAAAAANTLLALDGTAKLPASITGDADTVDGIHAASFMAAGTDDWVDESGDAMTGDLDLGGNDLVGIGTLQKAGSLLLHGPGLDNLGVGKNALAAGTTGSRNTAVGAGALLNNAGGGYNAAAGSNSLFDNTSGSKNSALGDGALRYNTTASFNTALGYHSLFMNTTGYRNTAGGSRSMRDNVTGSFNTAFGEYAMVANTGGNANTSLGFQTLTANTTGSRNTAVGVYAMASNTTGSYNTAIGELALGYRVSGTRNVGVGWKAGINATAGDDNIFLLNEGLAVDAAKIRIGTQGVQTGTFVAGIHGVPLIGSSVVVTSSGQLGTASGATGNADTVDGFHAGAAAAANALLALDGSGRLPASITGDADTVDGKHAADLVDKAGSTMTGALNLPADGLTVGAMQMTLAGGNVGINKAVPTEKLEVDGNVKATRFIGDGSNLTALPYRVLVAQDEFDREVVDSYWTTATTGLGSVALTNSLSQIRLSSGFGGAGSVNLVGNQSFALSSGPLIFRAKVGAYQDGGGIYGDGQPRGLANGTDRTNAIEFVSATQTSVTARTVSGGTATETTVSIGNSVYSLNFYQIVATESKVEFWVNGELVATHTTNIPTVSLNVYVGTDYGGFGEVPLDVDFLSFERIHEG